MKTRFLRFLLLSLLTTASASAVPVIASSTGLSFSRFTFDFTNPAPTTGANGTGATAQANGLFNLATYQHLGITFSLPNGQLRYSPGLDTFFNAGAPGFAGGYLGNYQALGSNSGGTSNNIVNIVFSGLVPSAALALQISNSFPDPLVLNALRGGVIIETFSSSTGVGGGFYGFENVVGGFDTLQITNPPGAGSHFLRMDSLQTMVPELDPRLGTLPCLFSLMLLAVLRERRGQSPCAG